MTTTRVMLLIDADNVSTDIVEQAVSRLHAEYGALHVRRAYGTAEAAVKHQRLFKRLSIRPMVNLAAGKNSTDIALAVDALDLVYSERPDVVVIASSDSDFAPLVARIREKGCLVRGVGQKGKVGEETPLVYDDFIEFEHRKTRGRAAADAGAAPAPRKTRARKSAAPASDEDGVSAAAAAPDAAAAATKKAAGAKAGNGGLADDGGATDAAAGSAPPAAKAVARKPAAGKPAARKRAAPQADAEPVADSQAEAMPSTAAPGAPPMPDKVARAFAALPQLAAGQPMDVQAAAAVLRKEHVFSNADSWPKFFARHADWFELTPAGRPTQVRRRLA